ncbi:MAG: hypothetical protein KC517_08875 [Bacteroidetes bacterium]|jgi:hypothetical protein|nr:hypothetical protein [Bacteroidota bacterium]
MKNILLILLLAVAIYMGYLGFKADMHPPIWTGIGFIIIAVLFYRNSK